MANMLEPIKTYCTKNFKSLFTNLLHCGPPKTTSRAACGRGLGSLALQNKNLHRSLASDCPTLQVFDARFATGWTYLFICTHFQRCKLRSLS